IRSRPVHVGLDADTIVETALELVEREGGSALTMRALAAELGVATTTIYWHVGNRDQLVVALISRMAQRLGGSEVSGSTASERVMDAARNIWRNALDHRNVTALASQVGATTLLELPLEVALLVELESAGLVGDDARDALRAVLACIAGFLVVAWRSEEVVPDALRAPALWSSVDPDGLNEASLAAMAEPPELDKLFERTLAAVVADLVRSGDLGSVAP
ncbi:MAG: TetR/AcrR family transcriptional regulator, partial [Microthrixaceae bacterium]